MKFLTPQLTYLLTQRELRALGSYLAFLAGTVFVYSIVFHVVMLWEGQDHSWLTGAYWTLTVVSCAQRGTPWPTRIRSALSP